MREVNYTPPSSSSVFRLGLSLLGRSRGRLRRCSRRGTGRSGRARRRAAVRRDRRRGGSRVALQASVGRHRAQDHRAEPEQALPEPRGLFARPAAGRISRSASRTSSRIRARSTRSTAISRAPSCGSSTRASLSGVKTIFGQYDAVRAIQERAGAEQRLRHGRHVGDHGGPISIISVQIENIDFSDAYEQSVEQRMLAQVEIQKPRAEPAHDGSRSADRAHARRRRGRGDPAARRGRGRGDPRARRGAAHRTPISCSCKPSRSGTASCRRRWCRARRCRSSTCSRGDSQPSSAANLEIP